MQSASSTATEVCPEPGRDADSHKVFPGHSAIYGMAHWAPEEVQTSAELEGMISSGISGLELDERLGMREKRVCDPELSLTDMTMQAVDRLLDQGTFDGEDINLDEVDLIIYFGVVPEYVEPATALLIGNRLGIKRAMAFDLSDACIGFADAWLTADSMIGTGRIRTALLVSAERPSQFAETAVDEISQGKPLREHFAALSLGDGSCAVLVGPKTRSRKTIELRAECRESYSEYSHLCVLPALDMPMITQSGRLISTAISLFPTMVHAVLDRIDWTIDDLDFYVAHQASLPGIKAASALMKVPFSKARNTIQEHGNMASVAVPFTLSKAIAEQEEWLPQKLMLVAFGSGLAIGIFALECR